MKHSESIAQLAAALSAAQGAMKPAAMDSQNPHFKSKYADLAACWEAIRKPLADNELAVIQTADVLPDGWVMVTTTLTHSSGEWVSGELSMQPQKDGPQAIGTVISYARRYSLAGIVGLSQADDDAEGATDHSAPAASSRRSGPQRKGRSADPAGGTSAPPAPPEAAPEVKQKLSAAADKGVDALRAAWEALTPEERRGIATHDLDWWSELKTASEAADDSEESENGDSDK